MSEKKQIFKIPLDNDEVQDDNKQWLKINAGQKALVRVAYTPTMTKRLKYGIQDKILCPEDRAALLLDAYALAKAGYTSIDTIVDLVKSYVNEDNGTVWTAIDSILSGLYLLLEKTGGAAFDSFVSFAKRIILNALHMIGWEESQRQGSKVDGHTDKLLRTTILGLVETFCYDDSNILQECRRRFDAHWENPSALPSEYKVYIYNIDYIYFNTYFFVCMVLYVFHII
jgi:aminopeptidase N